MKITSHPSDEINTSLGSKSNIQYDNNYSGPGTYAASTSGAPVAYPSHLSSSFHPTSNNSYPLSSTSSTTTSSSQAQAQAQPYSLIAPQQDYMPANGASFAHIGSNPHGINTATNINPNGVVKYQTAGSSLDSSSNHLSSMQQYNNSNNITSSVSSTSSYAGPTVMHSTGLNVMDTMTSSSSSMNNNSKTLNNANSNRDSMAMTAPGQILNQLKHKLIRVDFKKLKAPSIDKYLWYFEIDRNMNNDLVSVASSHFENQISNIITTVSNTNGDSSKANGSSYYEDEYDSDKDADLEGQVLPRFFQTLEVFEARKKRAKTQEQRTIQNDELLMNQLNQMVDGLNGNNEVMEEQNRKDGSKRFGNSSQRRLQCGIDKKGELAESKGLSRLNGSDANDDGIAGRNGNIQNGNTNTGYSSSNANGRGSQTLSNRDDMNSGKRGNTKRKREIEIASSTSTSSMANNAPTNGAVGSEVLHLPDIIPNGRHAAAFIDGTWVYSTVIKFNKKTKYYVVEDADEPAKGRPPTFDVPKSHVLMLFTEQECQSMPPYPSGSRVLAMFPQTTSFYPATISSVTTKRQKNKANASGNSTGNSGANSSFPANSAVTIEYLLQFDGDEKDELDATKVRKVPCHLVVSCAGVDGKLLESQDS